MVAEEKINPDYVRSDGTVVETNIHYPTDSSLRYDCYRTVRDRKNTFSVFSFSKRNVVKKSFFDNLQFFSTMPACSSRADAWNQKIPCFCGEKTLKTPHFIKFAGFSVYEPFFFLKPLKS